ncbi:MAG: YfiR family protein [Planctomycetes bacterium]|nr:YfiR family protein [Planctomycetota bacterium]
MIHTPIHSDTDRLAHRLGHRRRARGTGRAVVWMVLVATVTATLSSGASIRSDFGDEENAIKLMAAYIFNFIKFTTWPEERFEEKDSPYIITVVDEPVLYKLLSQAVKDKVVNDRSVQVVQTKYIAPVPDDDAPEAEASDNESATEQDAMRKQREDARRAAREKFTEQINTSHIVYHGHDEQSERKDVSAVCEESSVLYIGASKGFALDGGMVGFVLSERRLAFEINLEMTDLADIRISSKLLRLATIVKEKEDR